MVSEIKEAHLIEIQEIKLEHQREKANLETQYESLLEKHSDLDLRFKFLQS